MEIDNLIKYIKKIKKNRKTKKPNKQDILKFSLFLNRYLETKEANINAQGSDGYTALTWAASKGLFCVVQLLLQHGASANAENYLGDTALIWASSYSSYPEIVQLLLSNNANIEAVDAYGNTALKWATCCYGNEAVVDLLISQGAQVTDALRIDIRPPLPYFIGRAFLYASLEKADCCIPVPLPVGWLFSEIIENEISEHNHKIHQRIKSMSEVLASQNHLVPNISNIVMGYLFEAFKNVAQKRMISNSKPISSIAPSISL